jgi:hypothetical protein
MAIPEPFVRRAKATVFKEQKQISRLEVHTLRLPWAITDFRLMREVFQKLATIIYKKNQTIWISVNK